MEKRVRIIGFLSNVSKNCPRWLIYSKQFISLIIFHDTISLQERDIVDVKFGYDLLFADRISVVV